ncbi:hypothetical protein [Endozoicomonas euniceicola]|uniref:Uncharacterized protein n=1 Tax=Endozoicomonas euniceicola TaxID=1234143 RepID=A0ABY6GUB9_9GAMM|nr:hypothetical protein [Endozoicomonas euniceicola]UYM15646.1 hypothetical protein NX720_22895 [Endozoicomonas euniceicola]
MAALLDSAEQALPVTRLVRSFKEYLDKICVTFLQTASKLAIKTPLFPIVASNCYTFGGS